MDNEIASQVTLAKVKVGDYVRTTPTPADLGKGKRIVQTEHPKMRDGVPRKVTEAVKENGERHLVFEDGTRIVPRSGTALMWVYKLDAKGKPVPELRWPPCPTCGSTAPGCHVKGQPQQWTSTHKSRLPLIRSAQAKPTHKVDLDADGSVRVKDWAGGVREETTASGRHIRIEDDGKVTVLENGPRALTDDEADERNDGDPDDDAVKVTPCVKCKGYGLVRKLGPHAGEHYKTLNGAQTAMTRGNAVDCPVCQGTGEQGLVA